MGFKVKALRAGRWRDGAAGKEYDVEVGTVVDFREAADAAFFANGDAGEWHNERTDTSAGKSDVSEQPAPKPRKAKKNRGYDDVQEAASEQSDED